MPQYVKKIYDHLETGHFIRDTMIHFFGDKIYNTLVLGELDPIPAVTGWEAGLHSGQAASPSQGRGRQAVTPTGSRVSN